MKCLPVLALFAALCAASSASAQVVTTGSYYEEEKTLNCSGSSSLCELVFTAVPQNVLVTDVSCTASVTASPLLAWIGVSDSATGNGGGTTRRNTYFPLTQMATLSTTTYYATVFKTNFLFGTGKWPTIIIDSVNISTTHLDCKIVGSLQ
jgi:hypothetical protein